MHHVINVIFPIFALIFAGYICGKTGKLSENASAEINRFVVWLALPAQLFDFTSRQSWQTLFHPGFIAAFSASAFIVYFILLLLRKRKTKNWTEASFFSLSGSYANTGYMGIPLCILAFGQEALGPALISTLIVVCVLFSVAIVFIEIGKQSHQSPIQITQVVIKSLMTNPLLVAPVVGAILSTANVELYAPFRQFVTYLGAAASPCALVSIGLFLIPKKQQTTKEDEQHLSDSSISSLNQDAWTLVIVKLIVQPLITWVIAGPILNLPTFWVNSAVLLSALPTGTGPFMLAQYYKADGVLISRVVLLTTLGSVLTLSALLWLMAR